MENFNIINKFISLSESTDGTKLHGKVLICPLDVANGNGVGIKKTDISDEEIQSLVGQPAVAKVIKNAQGELDFGGHELKKIKEYNVETKKLETKYFFDTQPIGVFKKVWVEDTVLNGITTTCIFADVEFWTRYENAISIITKLFDEGNLHISWEITYSEKYFDEGISWRKGVTFIGVAVLGTSNPPAYPDSGIFEISELDTSEDLAKALTKDIMKETELKNDLEKSELNINENQGGNIMPEKENGTESTKIAVSALTVNDLRTRLREAMNAANPRDYFYISKIYPYEYRAICESDYQKSEDSYVEFTYTVNSDETVSITSQKDVKVQFISTEQITALTTSISEKEAKITEVEKELSEKNEMIIKLDAKVSEKDASIAELQPFKEKVEQAEKEVAEKEVAEKKKSLKALALKSKYITEEDLKVPEISELIENLDEKGIKAIIADRVMEKAEKETVKEVSEKKTEVEEEVETSEESNLDCSNEESDMGESIMSLFLKRK